jgi:predicted small metal-binding protein
MKVLRCKDFGMECDFEARAETEEEVLRLAAEHAKFHGLEEVPPTILGIIKAAIHDE